MAGMPADRVPGLQVGTDPAFDARQWKVERAGWLVMFLIVVLALAGIFGGGGPLMSASTRNGDAEVHYNRMIRFLGPTTIRVVVPVDGQEARLTFNKGFAEDMRVERVIPDPESVEAAPEGVTYTFAAAEGVQQVEAVFSVKPERIGVHSTDITTGSGALSFWQFAFP